MQIVGRCGLRTGDKEETRGTHARRQAGRHARTHARTQSALTVVGLFFSFSFFLFLLPFSVVFLFFLWVSFDVCGYQTGPVSKLAVRGPNHGGNGDAKRSKVIREIDSQQWPLATWTPTLSTRKSFVRRGESANKDAHKIG